jgi:hypothetical protein
MGELLEHQVHSDARALYDRLSGQYARIRNDPLTVKLLIFVHN